MPCFPSGSSIWLRIIAILALVGSSTLALSAGVQPKIKVEKNVTYFKVDGKELKLDIASPDGTGPYPAVVCIHGGAWRFGSRKDLDFVIEDLAERGFVAAAVSYRLLPDGKFPDPVVDCRTAVRFLRAHSDKYHINKERFGALGFSAGGYLAAMLGVETNDPSFDGKEFADQSSKVQAVVDYFGPSDLTLYGKDEFAQNSTLEPLLGARFKDNPDVYKKASPITYVSKNAAAFLFLHGTKDWIVSIEHSRQMCKKLQEAGVKATTVEIEGESHGWRGAKSKETWAATYKFLEEQLKK